MELLLLCLPSWFRQHYFKLFQARGIESRGTDPAGQSTECLPSVGMVRVELSAPRRPPPKDEQDGESRGTDPAGQSTECLPSVGMVRVELSAPRRPPPKDEQDGESRGTDPAGQSTECLPSVGMVRVEPSAPRRPPPEERKQNREGPAEVQEEERRIDGPDLLLGTQLPQDATTTS